MMQAESSKVGRSAGLPIVLDSPRVRAGRIEKKRASSYRSIGKTRAIDIGQSFRANSASGNARVQYGNVYVQGDYNSVALDDLRTVTALDKCSSRECAELISRLRFLTTQCTTTLQSKHGMEVAEPSSAEEKLMAMLYWLRDTKTLPQQISENLPVFKDAFGSATFIDTRYVPSWNAFESLLCNSIRERPGRHGLQRVKSLRYRLHDSSRKDIIIDPRRNRGAFRFVFMPGRVVSMSMYFEWDEVSYDSCPRCHHEQLHMPDADTICSNCDFIYRSLRAEEAAQPVEQTPTGTGVVEANAMMSPRSPGASVDVPDKPEHFSRICIGAKPKVPTPDEGDQSQQPSTPATFFPPNEAPSDNFVKPNSVGAHEEPPMHVGRLWPGMHSQQAQQAAMQKAAQAQAVQQLQKIHQAQQAQYQQATNPAQETSNSDASQDWFALPLDPLLTMSGADVDQTMYGPQLEGRDMLDILLDPRNGTLDGAANVNSDSTAMHTSSDRDRVQLNNGFSAESSNAWFMPFNLEPPTNGKENNNAGFWQNIGHDIEELRRDLADSDDESGGDDAPRHSTSQPEHIKETTASQEQHKPWDPTAIFKQWNAAFGPGISPPGRPANPHSMSPIATPFVSPQQWREVVASSNVSGNSSNAGETRVPTTLNVEDWFTFFGIDQDEQPRMATISQPNPNTQILRTESQAFQDELYNPNQTYASAAPKSQKQSLSRDSNLITERLQTANQARSTTPNSAISRERSPFRDGSLLAPPTQAISPKDALLDYT